MHELLTSLEQLFQALWGILHSLGALLLPWTPLFAWIAFWLFAVNWVSLRRVLVSGGWIGLALIGVVWIMVWGVVAPPPEGTHYIAGLSLSNFVGKTVYVTALICIMLLCGSVQLSGAVGGWGRFEEETAEPEPHGHGH